MAVQAIQAIYIDENSSSAVLLNSQLGEFFKKTVGVRQECLLSPILFNLLRDKIMLEPLHDHHTSISIGGRPICNLRFTDIDLMDSKNRELQDLTNRLVDRATVYGMEVSTEKGTNNIKADIRMNDQKFEEVTSFKCLGATMCKDGTCSAEVRIRITSAMTATARLNRI